MSTQNLMFDPDLTEAVTDAVTALGLPAVVDHYEIGMAQVRIDPTDDAPTGYIAVAGSNDAGQDRWVLVGTDRQDDGSYDTPEYQVVTDLDLLHDAPVEVVADAIVYAISGVKSL